MPGTNGEIRDPDPSRLCATCPCSSRSTTHVDEHLALGIAEGQLGDPHGKPSSSSPVVKRGEHVTHQSVLMIGGPPSGSVRAPILSWTNSRRPVRHVTMHQLQPPKLRWRSRGRLRHLLARPPPTPSPPSAVRSRGTSTPSGRPRPPMRSRPYGVATVGMAVDVRCAPARSPMPPADAAAAVGTIGGVVHAAGVPDAVEGRPHRQDLGSPHRGQPARYAMVVQAFLSQLRANVPMPRWSASRPSTASSPTPRTPRTWCRKAGVLGLTRSMAVRFAQEGIRVNSICPGFIATPMLPDIGDLYDRFAAASPMARVGTLTVGDRNDRPVPPAPTPASSPARRWSSTAGARSGDM